MHTAVNMDSYCPSPKLKIEFSRDVTVMDKSTVLAGLNFPDTILRLQN